MPPPRPPLLPIIAHARSGALDHAWRLFREAGLEAVADDAAVLSVKGRLLKDRALSAQGEARQRFYLEAAEAYGEAAAIAGTTYPLINAATLSLLAGRPGEAAVRAGQALDRLERGAGEPDTPYWEAATRAEALLLLDRGGEARAALAAAVALAPRAWEDHASTLRQFALILAARGQDAAWLDAFRPPRSLHFGGHMDLGAGEDPGLRARVETVLEREAIGFGYGAPAAGADLVIAEALLARGAELHLVLPGAPDVFRRESVERYGPAWADRFDAAVGRAESLRVVGRSSEPPGPLSIQLAAEAAMGQAVMHATTLTSEAVQLLILEDAQAEPATAGASAWIRAVWAASGRRQHILTAPRDKAQAPPVPEARSPAALSLLAAMLAVRLSGDAVQDHDRLASELLPRLGRIVGRGPAPLTPPRWSGETLALSFARPGQAAAVALELVRDMPAEAGVSIGGHFGVVRRAQDPFGPGALLLGDQAALAEEAVRAAPPGAIHLTEDFATAMLAEGPATGRLEYVGDLAPRDIDDELRLFSLKA